jgi:hypothetical protein
MDTKTVKAALGNQYPYLVLGQRLGLLTSLIVSVPAPDYGDVSVTLFSYLRRLDLLDAESELFRWEIPW